MGWPVLTAARGVWVKIPAVEVVEVLAGAGVDVVVIDQEHGAIDVRAMLALVAVAQREGMRAFVRLAGHAPSEVQPALDAGADGVFLPHIDTADDARAVVAASRFPPVGHRHGSPMTRAGGWRGADARALIDHANTHVAVVVQIETAAAVAAVDEILAVEGIDAIFIGPFDLSLSTGLAPDSPEFRTLVRRVETAKRGARRLGGVASGADDAREMLAGGYDFVMIGADTGLLGRGARAGMSGATR